jgi:hypothetical protein
MIKDQVTEKIGEFIKRTMSHPTEMHMTSDQFEEFRKEEPMVSSHYRGCEIILHDKPEIEAIGFKNQITLFQKVNGEFKELRVFDTNNPTISIDGGVLTIMSKEESFVGSINDYSAYGKMIRIE